jgi:hypothetical protein
VLKGWNIKNEIKKSNFQLKSLSLQNTLNWKGLRVVHMDVVTPFMFVKFHDFLLVSLSFFIVRTPVVFTNINGVTTSICSITMNYNEPWRQSV